MASSLIDIAHASGPGLLGREEKSEENVVESGQQSLRLDVPLLKLHSEGHYQLNWLDMVADREMADGGHPKEQGASEGNEDDDSHLRSLAAKFEKKYGKTSLDVRSKKKKRMLDDYADLGYGYDSEDSFIDNSDVHDEIVPGHVDTAMGGFYVNAGKLEFTAKEVDETMEALLEDPTKVPNKKRKLGSASDVKPVTNHTLAKGQNSSSKAVDRPVKKKRAKTSHPATTGNEATTVKVKKYVDESHLQNKKKVKKEVNKSQKNASVDQKTPPEETEVAKKLSLAAGKPTSQPKEDIQQHQPSNECPSALNAPSSDFKKPVPSAKVIKRNKAKAPHNQCIEKLPKATVRLHKVRVPKITGQSAAFKGSKAKSSKMSKKTKKGSLSSEPSSPRAGIVGPTAGLSDKDAQVTLTNIVGKDSKAVMLASLADIGSISKKEGDGAPVKSSTPKTLVKVPKDIEKLLQGHTQVFAKCANIYDKKSKKNSLSNQSSPTSSQNQQQKAFQAQSKSDLLKESPKMKENFHAAKQAAKVVNPSKSKKDSGPKGQKQSPLLNKETSSVIKVSKKNGTKNANTKRANSSQILGTNGAASVDSPKPSS